MTQIANDTFTEASDTGATSHTSDSGHGWFNLPNTTGAATVIASGDYLRGDSGSNSFHGRLNVSPSAADYTVRGDIRWSVKTDVTGLVGVMLRCAFATFFTCYQVRYVGNATPASRKIDVVRVVNSAQAVIGSYFVDLNNDQFYKVKTFIIGTGAQVDLYVFLDDALVLTIADTDASRIVATGQPGLLTRLNSRIDNFVVDDDVTLPGGQTIDAGLAEEADTALAAGKAKAKAVGIATETSIALGVTWVKSRPVGLAVETDAALGVLAAIGGQVGIATETDTALGVGKAKRKASGLAAEADSALAAVARKTRAVGLAAEADSALAAGRVKRKTVGVAAEASSALAVGKAKRKAVGLAEESDAALHAAVIGGTSPSTLPPRGVTSRRPDHSVTSRRPDRTVTSRRPGRATTTHN